MRRCYADASSSYHGLYGEIDKNHVTGTSFAIPGARVLTDYLLNHPPLNIPI